MFFWRLDKVVEEIEKQLSVLPRNEIAKQALEHSKIILVKDMEEILKKAYKGN